MGLLKVCVKRRFLCSNEHRVELIPLNFRDVGGVRQTRPVTVRHHLIRDTPIGDLTVVADGGALTAVYMIEHRHAPADGTFGPLAGQDDEVCQAAESQLREYFDGDRQEFDLPLAPAGTEFQQKVWMALRTIGYGETESYGEVAARIGSPSASRAVGLANGRNPISIIVPCHRVIGADGSLTGYGGGIERKTILLDLEQRGSGSRLF